MQGAAVARPVGECRPGWKVLRVLGNLIDLPDCDYDTGEALRDELRQLLNDIGPTKLAPDNSIPLEKAPDVVVSDESDALDVPIYSTDSLVRRSRSLQLTRDGRPMVSEKRKIA